MVDDFQVPKPWEERRNVAAVTGKHVPGTVDFWKRLEQELLTQRRDQIISINPATDLRSGVDENFERKVSYVTSAVAMSEQMVNKKFVVSERYHGCILALKWGLPVYGIALRSATVTSKITELYRRLDLDDFLIRPTSGLRRGRLARQVQEGFDFTAINQRLHAQQEELRAYLRDCLTL